MRALALAALLSVAGCGGGLATPPLGAHEAGEPSLVVPYPPPPARVEIVRPPPADDVERVWVDGQWRWEANRWVWHSGDYQLPQPGAVYAPPETVRLADGTLIHRPGRWRIAP